MAVERRASEDRAAPGRSLGMLVVCLGVVLSSLDGAIVNVALPSIAAALHASPAASVWVATAYLLAVIAGLLPFASLGEAVGYRRVYLGGMAVFLAGSLACAVSPTLPALIAARVLQGLGGAAMISISMALVRLLYPGPGLGRAVALYGMTAAAAMSFGPSVGAGILTLSAWPWLFAVNLPIGAAAMAIGLRRLPAGEGRGGRLDLPAAALSAMMFVGVVSGVDALGRAGEAVRAFTLMAGGVVAGGVLALRQRGKPAPLLPLDLLKFPAFALAAATSVCTYACQAASFVALPFLFEHGLGRSASATGLLMTPWPLMVVFAGPVSGRLADRLPGGAMTGAGAAVLCCGVVLLAFLPAHATSVDIVWRMLLCGAGMGLFQAPNNRALLTAAPAERTGAASGMVAVARMLGMALGAATASMALAAFGSRGATTALDLAAALAGLGALFSLSRAATGAPGRRSSEPAR